MSTYLGPTDDPANEIYSMHVFRRQTWAKSLQNCVLRICHQERQLWGTLYTRLPGIYKLAFRTKNTMKTLHIG